MINPAAFTWLPLLAFSWIAIAIAISAAFRKERGKPIFPTAPTDAIFYERGCSGRSLDTTWARVGGARNCLLVVLRPHELTIVPTFPFNLLFLPEIYGLDHSLDTSSIREVCEQKASVGRRLTITYAEPKVRRVELRLRHHDAFIDGLRKLGVGVTRV